VEQRDIIDLEPQQLAARASEVGSRRLDRSPVDILITGGVAGVEVSLGGLAAMAVVGSALTAVPQLGLYGALALGGLVFPVGFFFVIVGRSELFTENFLIPVLGVLKPQRGPFSLAQVWGLSWVGNLIGCALMALVLSVPEALGVPIHKGYMEYAAYKLSVPPLATLVSGVLAGTVMTVLTWLLLALQDPVGKVLAIFAAGYVLFAANLSHSIVGASVLFVGFLPAHKTFGQLAVWLLMASIGNLIGGVGFVTAFRIAQVKEKKRQH
jgi:formate/nitrite transporter FocA (FNT family)